MVVTTNELALALQPGGVGREAVVPQNAHATPAEVSRHLEHAERVRDGTDHPLAQHSLRAGARKDPRGEAAPAPNGPDLE